MLHASLSLIEHPFSLSIWSVALHSALDARQKEHRSSLLFFLCSPLQLYIARWAAPQQSPLTPDWRQAAS